MNRSGFSVVEAMLFLGILAVGGLGLMTLSQQMNKSSKNIERRFDREELKNQILVWMQDSAMCTCQINLPGMSFNAGVTDGTQFISLNTLKMGCGAGDPVLVSKGQRLSSGLVVESIRLANLKPTGAPNRWKGDWEVAFESNGPHLSLKPLTVSQFVSLDSTTPDGAKKIDKCYGSGSGGSGISAKGRIPIPLKHGTNQSEIREAEANLLVMAFAVQAQGSGSEDTPMAKQPSIVVLPEGCSMNFACALKHIDNAYVMKGEKYYIEHGSGGFYIPLE